jgi:hypothetical protein
MTLPQLKVEVSFTEYPQLPPTWTDISPWVQSASIRRGRQNELDRFEAGEATVVVDNSDHRFYPYNNSSPYYPYVDVDRRLRISAVYKGITYPLFTGYVNAWPQEREGYNDFFGEVTVTDAFKVLSLNLLTMSVPEQRSDLRIHDILDACDWITGGIWVLDDAVYSLLGSSTVVGPTNDRHIVTGASVMQADDLDNESALQHIQMVQQSENGTMFIGKEGQFYYFGRHARLAPPFTEVQATFTDDDGGLWVPGIPTNLRKYPYVAGSLKLRYDDTNLWTKVIVKRTGGATITVVDDMPGPVKYWHRVKKFDIPVTTDNEAEDAANFYLGRYKGPKMRAEEMSVHGEFMDQQDVLWPLILQRELSDRIRVEYTPKKPLNPNPYLVDYADPDISYADPDIFYTGKLANPALELKLVQDSFIESISIDIDCQEDPTWETVFAISPAETQSFWILDDPVSSVLGETTRLSY